MASALYSAGTKYGLLALLLFSIITITEFYFSDTFRLSDLQFRGHGHGNDSAQDAYEDQRSSKPSHNNYNGGLRDIQNATLGFQKIYVLSMPTRSDKRDMMVLSARMSGLEIEFVDGVNGSNVPIVARPEGWEDVFSFDSGNPDANLGCWRGHMDIYQKIVQENIQTALLIEDDVDWDVMIKSQMTEIARGSRQLADNKNNNHGHSPYGDDWWLISTGNCATRDNFDGDQKRYIIENDPTVLPQKRRDMIFEPFTKPQALAGPYTRLLFDLRSMICTGSYAITLQAATYMMYDQSMQPHARTIDFALSDFCKGPGAGRCLGVYPPVTGIYYPAGDSAKGSDRTDKIGRNENASAVNLVYSARMNIERLLRGEKVMLSQYPEESLAKDIDRTSPHAYPAGRLVTLPASEYTQVYSEEMARRKKDEVWREERRLEFRKKTEEKQRVRIAEKKKADEEKKKKKEDEEKQKKEDEEKEKLKGE